MKNSTTVVQQLAQFNELAEFKAFRNMLIFTPIRDGILRSIVCSPVRHEKQKFNLICAYNPLYQFHEGLYLTFSRTLIRRNISNGGQRDEWTPQDINEMLDVIKKEGILYLNLISDAKQFAELARNITTEKNIDESIICSLVKNGNYLEAKIRLKVFYLVNFLMPSDDPLRLRLNQLDFALKKSENDAKDLLRKWFEESINNLELVEFLNSQSPLCVYDG